MNNKLSTTTLADKVEEQIISYIREKSLLPGDALPNEKKLGEMFGISRNVVRESLSRLRMLGLIDSRTKRGIVVTEPPLLNGFRKILDPHLLSTKTIKEMMGMRIALEIGIAEFLFANVSDENINELEQIVSRQQSIGINNLSIEDELIFHAKIYEIAGNNFITQFNEIMHPVFVFAKHNYEEYFKPISEQLNKKGEIIKHEDLLQTIKEKNKEGYQNAVSGHLKPYWEFMHNF
jgi:GntR family transcriptional repressor for pyruvate dehydrogenase complex